MASGACGRTYSVMSIRPAGSSGSATTSESSAVLGGMSKWPGRCRGLATAGRSEKSFLIVRLDLVGLDVADHDDGLQIGAIPVVVEAAQRVGRHRSQAALGADRHPLGVAAVVEHARQRLAADALFGRLSAAQLREHDVALRFDVGVGQRRVAGPLPQDRQAVLEHRLVADRDREDVDRLVVAGVGVEVAAEADAHRLEVGHQLVLRKPLRPVERHVLDVVRRAELVVVFEDRSGVDHQPELRAPLRPLVGADEIAQPVGQPALAYRADERDGRRGRRLRGGREGDRAERQDSEEGTGAQRRKRHGHGI